MAHPQTLLVRSRSRLALSCFTLSATVACGNGAMGDAIGGAGQSLTGTPTAGSTGASTGMAGSNGQVTPSGGGGVASSGGTPSGGAPVTPSSAGSAGMGVVSGNGGSAGAATPMGGSSSGAGAGTGGSNDGGTGGVGSGGTEANGGAGGAAVGATGDPAPSSGCGEAPPASDRYTIDVDGSSREYILAVPDDYDPDNAYRLVFTWHPWGGSAQQVAGSGSGGYYGLLSASGGQAIFVSPEGLDFGGNGLGWGNEGGQDIAFLEAMLDRFDAELCFDHNRVFSTGFSFGGMMSNAVGCAGLARAIAPMAGNSQVSGCADGTQPVAFMGFHGESDQVVSLSGGQAARDVFVERNGCGAETASDSDWCDVAGSNFAPCACTTYDGCDDGFPVTWCEYNGTHMVAPNSGETIWSFFSQF